eukprot:460451_1
MSKKYIVCIDTSGSMGGTKISDAVSAGLKWFDEGDQKENSLYHFTESVTGPVNRDTFAKLINTYGGGTSIQKCLFDLFNNILPRELSNTGCKYTEFWFITDAEDNISDENGLINAKKQCQTKYSQTGKTLYCKEFLVGNGGCKAALSKIFAGGHFEGGVNDLKRLLKDAEEQTRKSNAVQQECDDLSSTLSRLDYTNTSQVEETMIKIAEIKSKVDAIENEVLSVETAAASAKSEYDTLVNEHGDVKSLIENAQTEEEIERAEEKGFELSVKYSTLRSEIIKAQNKASAVVQQLIAAQTQAHGVQTPSQKNYNKISEKLQQIKSKISGLLNTLQSLTSEQAKDMKKEIKSQLGKVRKMMENAGKPCTTLFKVTKDMMNFFNALKKPQRDLRQTKSDLESRIQEVDNLMDELDERA